MTETEFRTFINDLHAKGWDDENIAKMFAKMYQDRKISRDGFVGLLEAIGYGLTEEFQKLDDEELRERVLKRE